MGFDQAATVRRATLLRLRRRQVERELARIRQTLIREEGQCRALAAALRTSTERGEAMTQAGRAVLSQELPTRGGHRAALSQPASEAIERRQRERIDVQQGAELRYAAGLRNAAELRSRARFAGCCLELGFRSREEAAALHRELHHAECRTAPLRLLASQLEDRRVTFERRTAEQQLLIEGCLDELEDGECEELVMSRLVGGDPSAVIRRRQRESE